MLSCGCCRYAVLAYMHCKHVACLASCYTSSKRQQEQCVCVVCLQWLINAAESVYSADTGWSDLLSEVLLTLHSASDTTSKNSK